MPDPCEQPGHEFVGQTLERCPNCGSDDLNRRYTDAHLHAEPDAPIWRYTCRACARGPFYDPKGPDPEHDGATHRVRILAPQEAIDANGQDEFACGACAITLAGAYIGFGWDVEVKRKENT
jgi:hypothetical protein